MTAQLARTGAKIHEILNAPIVADQNENAAGLEAHVRRRRGDQPAADPLADNGDAGVLAEISLRQGLASEDAVAGNASLTDDELVAEMLDARYRRTDFATGARRQRRAEHVTRRVCRRSAR